VIEAPTASELSALATALGFELDAAALAAFETLIPEFLAAYDQIEELQDRRWPPAAARTSWLPDERDDQLGAFLVCCSIREAEAGPLAGRTLAVKDNIAVAGMPSLNGSPLFEGWVPNEDATVVRRVLAAGATVVGKTKVPGFCFDGAGITCYPEPQPRNPYAPERLPGGSSSGSAVAVASGGVELALGTDTGGSIRMPASWSGCCGLKPTFGLVPLTGVLPLERSLDHVGPLAGTVADCAVLLEVLSGPDGLDERAQQEPAQSYTDRIEAGLDGVTVGVLREGFGRPGISEPDVDAAVLDACTLLERTGARVIDCSVPLHRDAAAIWSGIAVQGSAYQMFSSDGVGSNHRGRYSPELAELFGRARRERATLLPATVKISLLLAEHLSRVATHRYYAKAQNLGLALRAAYDETLSHCDVLVLPTTPMQAMPRPTAPSIEQTIRIAFGVLYNTAPFNISGHPALSVPCALANGLPIGLMIVGKRFEERTVLQVGAAYESARGRWSGPGADTAQ
jgi:amidase